MTGLANQQPLQVEQREVTVHVHLQAAVHRLNCSARVTLMVGTLACGLPLVNALGAAADAATIQGVCQPLLIPPHAELNKPTTAATLLALQDSSDPGSLPLACQLWAAAAAGNPGNAALQQQAAVLASLLAVNRAAPVLALGPGLYRELLAQTPPQPAPAGQVAGLLGLAYFRRDEFDTSLAWSDKAIVALQADPAASDALDPALRWVERINHAVYLNQMRRYAAAEAELRVLWQELQPRNDRVAQQVLVLRGLTRNAATQGRHDESLALAEQEVALRRAHLPDDRVDLALALQNVAATLMLKARYEEAEALYKQALAVPLADDPDPNNVVAGINENYAGLAIARGKPAEALQATRTAAERIARSPAANTPRAARPLRRMASAQQALGDLGGAVQTWRRALALLGQSGQTADDQTSLAAHLGYGAALVVLGDARAAEAELEQARLKLASAGNPAGQRLHWLRLQASVLAATERPEASEQALAEAIELMRKVYPASHELPASTQARRCQLNPQQCAALEPWLALPPGHEPLSPDTEADIGLALARHARLSGQRTLARARAIRTLSAAYAATLPNMQWQAYDELAQGYAADGRLTEAILLAKQAVLILQNIRAGLIPLGTSADNGFMQNKQELYRRLADWLMGEQRLAEGVQVLQLLKRREQDDFVERADSAGLGELSLTAQEQDRLGRLTRWLRAQAPDGAEDAALARLRRLQSADRISDAEKAELLRWRQALAASQQSRQQALQVALSQILEEVPALKSRPVVSAAAASPAPSLLRPASQHVMHAHLVLGEQRLSVLTLGPRSQQLVQLPLSRAAVHRAIAEFLDAIQRRADVLPQARALHAQVGAALDDAARRQGATHITLWLDGGLRYLPFGALHDGQQYLAQKYQLALAAPVPLAALADHQKTPAPNRMLALGLSQAVAGMAALPGVGAELCAIVNGPVRGLNLPTAGCLQGAPQGPLQGSGPMPGRADMNQFFTERSLSAAGAADGPPNLLHIGTHFTLRPGNVTRSTLLLGDGQPLSLARLRALPPMPRQRLVVLSACESGVPVLGADGVEVDGLAASWMARGADRVLASLWRVEDQATAAFMQRFYQALARAPQDYRAALHAAQGWGGNTPPAHPYVWAAFNLIERSP